MIVVDADVLVAPCLQLGRTLDAAHVLAEESLIRCEPLQLYTGAQHILQIDIRCIHGSHLIILQHSQFDITQVLLSQYAEQFLCHQLVGSLVQELLDGSVVTAPVFNRHGSLVGMTDTVLVSRTTVVLSTLLSSYQRQLTTNWWWHDIEIHQIRQFLAVQHDFHLLVLTERYLTGSHQATFRYPQQHVALTGSQRGMAQLVSSLVSYGVELSIVIQLKLYAGTRNRLAFSVNHLYVNLRGRCIVIYHVNLCVTRCLAHHLLRSVVVTKSLGVHQHTTRGTLVKPTQVQHRLWLAGTQEVPLAIGPGLYPRMVIVGMRPTRGINLTGRNTYGTQGCNSKSALLATASISRTERCQRTAGSAIRRTIRHVLVAPVVHLEDSLLHTQFLNTGLEGLVEHLATVVEILVVNSHGHHKMAELALWNGFAPWHLSTCFERQGNVLLVELATVISLVWLWHKLVKVVHIAVAGLSAGW